MSAPEKYTPTFDTTSSVLSSSAFVFINWSVTCAFPVAVSFITRPGKFSPVPTYACHNTVYVSSFSVSDIPLYIFNGFSFEIIYLVVGSYTLFPTVTSNLDTVPFAFS